MRKTKKPRTPRFDDINPSGCINAKLRRLHRLINTVYMQRLKPFGLRGSMLSILFIIGKKPGVNQKDLAEALVLDASTMSRDLKSLVDRGLVAMVTGEDSRSKEHSLTADGFRMVDEVAPVWHELHTRFESILGEFSIQQIDHITAAIQGNLSTSSP